MTDKQFLRFINSYAVNKSYFWQKTYPDAHPSGIHQRTGPGAYRSLNQKQIDNLKKEVEQFLDYVNNGKT